MSLYVVVQTLPLLVRRSRPIESLVLVTAIAMAFRLLDSPIQSYSIFPVWSSWPSLFRPDALVTIFAASIAGYNVGYRSDLKRIAGAVSAVVALSITVLILSVGERFPGVYSFFVTLLLIVTIGICLGVAARRMRTPAAATPTAVQRQTPRASIRAIAIDRLLQGAATETVSQEFSLPPEHIQEWRNQLTQSIDKTDHTPKRESFWSRLGHWPAIAALLGLLLYLPTYIAYEYFYGSLGVSPDEVGLNYSTVLSREATWLLSSILILSAALGALYLCYVAAAHPVSVRRTLISAGLPAPSKSAIRYSGLLVGLPLIAVLVQSTIYQVNSVPAKDAFDGMPIYADPRSFFKGRADFVEVSWIRDAPPPGIPRRLLYLGQSAGTAVFWNATEQTPIRIPASSITITSIYAESRYSLDVLDNGELWLSPEEDFGDISSWPLAVRYPARGERGCSTEKWTEAIQRVSPPSTRVIRVPSKSPLGAGPPALDLLYVPPDYRSLSVELVRAGAPLDKRWLRDGMSHMTQVELLEAAQDAHKSGRKLPLPCLR
jgi:hypothetical protein